MPGAQLCNRPRVLLGSSSATGPGFCSLWFPHQRWHASVTGSDCCQRCRHTLALTITTERLLDSIWCLPATRHPRPTYVHGALLCNRRLEPEARGYAHSKICSPEVFCASDRVGLAVKDPPAPCGALRNVRQPPHTDVLVETCRSTSLASCARCHEMYHIPKCHGTGVMMS
jgi:hypothetical protein